MTTSRTPFLAELAAGHTGPAIPSSKRAYFQQRLRLRVFNFLLEKFVVAQANGLNKTILARRIGKTPDVVNRWLSAPSNLTLDTVSDLLLGIAAEELELASTSPLHQVANNFSQFEVKRAALLEARVVAQNKKPSRFERASVQAFNTSEGDEAKVHPGVSAANAAYVGESASQQ